MSFMRISEKERRQLERRLKNRLPPSFFSSVKRTPRLVLIVSASFFITPEAYAKVLSKQAVPRIVLSSTKTAELPRIYEKTYTKDELQKTLPPNPVVGLDDRIAGEVSQLLNHIAVSQGGAEQLAALETLKTMPADEANYFTLIAAMKDPPKRNVVDGDRLRTYFAGEGQKAGSERIKARSEVLQNLTGGLNFNLDVASLFKDTPPEAIHSGTVRYGLILEDIVPSEKAYHRAAINGDMTNELQFAGHADVKWTIGPVAEEHGRKIWSVPPPSEPLPEKGPFKLPKPNFSGRVLPENLVNFSKVDPQNLPALNFEVYQTEQYYRLNYRTQMNGERLSEEHTFLLPLAGTASFGRRFNDQWEVVSSSAYNILIDKRMPLVSIHYWNIEERYSADMALHIGRHRISCTARGKATGPVELEEHRPEHYTFNYGTDF